MVRMRYAASARHSGCSTDILMTRSRLANSPRPPLCPSSWSFGSGARRTRPYGSLLTGCPLRGLLGLLLRLGRVRDLPLGCGRVDVDVLLAGELHDLVHDLV